MQLGIVGNGMIVNRMLRDLSALPDVTGVALCVREQSKEKGEALAREFGVQKVYTDYETFLNDADIDTVYIGIVNNMHFAYAKKALLYRRNVICEKPFTVTAAETKELAALAKEKNLFLWEAFKIPYSPIFQAVKAHLSEIGKIKLVQCNYSRVSSRYEKYASGVVLPAFDPAYAGGCLYDINLYNLHFVTGLFGRPENVHYYANKGFNGVDTSGTAILEYGGFHAVCVGAKDSSSPCFAVIQGEKGYIRVEGPASSAEYATITTGGETRKIAEDAERGTLVAEVREFARQLHSQDKKACGDMLSHSVMMMEVLETAANQR